MTTTAELVEQESRLQFARFSNEDAWRLGCLLVDMARERELPVTIDIRRGDQQLFHCAMPGTCADNDAWIERKIRVVRRYGASSYLVGQRFREQGSSFEEKSRLDPDRYAAHGGAFPVVVVDAGLVGTVAVSGLRQLADHKLVVEALEKFLEG
ncbi:heme-degrading domain-containing protein [Streptacidiphilus rugosus]|uniref:heme-degrading domain-containing protein n=1 Tax=Streptacidiphilus rugosus TaxID=405783 RepID=UPI000569D384|nr:heme-degrading domain-containing protein [Streptacidiphilus rugosus]